MGKSMVRIWVVLLLAGCLTSCGGGGGVSSSAPVISNLRFSPASATFRQGGGTVAVTGYIDFTDPNGDLANLRLTSSAGADITSPVTGISGQTSGTIYGIFNVSTESIGTYTFEVWVIDSQGNSSNKLTGTFEVKIDDTGAQWTTRTSGTTANLRDVVWSGTLFVAIGDSGIILTSSDGISWTQRTSGTSNALWGVIWSGTQFVVVGDYGTVLTSPDGINWTQQKAGLPNSSLKDIAWSGTQFVVVGSTGVGSTGVPYLILTSPDGFTWTQTVSGLLNSRPLNGVIWSGTQFVAVGYDALILISPDGINWIQRFSDYFNTWFDITWDGSQYITVGSFGGSSVLASTDGITWVSRTSNSLSLLQNSKYFHFKPVQGYPVIPF